MRFDFWNNPIVVSAFRVKYRRGGLISLAVAYVMLLAVGWMVMQYYADQIRGPWPRYYFLGVIGVQMALSGLIAGNATATSMKAEVTNRTLDFQRIAAISPQEILLGKLLGEPALAYLLLIAGIPLAFLPVILGAVGFDEFLLAYLTLATTTLLCGTLGLLHKLEMPTGKSAGSGGGAGFVISYLIVSGVFLMNSRDMMQRPWSAAVAGFVSPTALLRGVYVEDVWGFGFPFFGAHAPLVLVAPAVQLAGAFLCFHVMVRRLVNPILPPLSKPHAYLLLAVIDVLAAGILFDPMAARLRPLAKPLTAGQTAAAFCLAHLIASVWLTMNITAWKETLRSWVWRYRGRQPLVADLLYGPRSENSLALAVFCGIGLAALGLLVVLPKSIGGVVFDWRDVAGPALALVVLTLCFGVSLQWSLFLGGRGVGGALIVPLGILVAAPHILGAYYQIPLLSSLSISGQFAAWFGVPPELPVWPMLGLYAFILVLMWWSLRSNLRLLEKSVDGKLELMGAKAV